MTLDKVFSEKCIILDLKSTNKDDLFEEMVKKIVSVQPKIDLNQAVNALRDRESKMSTGIMHSIAIPHGTCSSVPHVIGAIGISKGGIDYDSLDKSPVHIVFMILFNHDETENHLAVLQSLASFLQDPSFVRQLLEQTSEDSVFSLLKNFDAGN